MSKNTLCTSPNMLSLLLMPVNPIYRHCCLLYESYKTLSVPLKNAELLNFNADCNYSNSFALNG